MCSNYLLNLLITPKNAFFSSRWHSLLCYIQKIIICTNKTDQSTNLLFLIGIDVTDRIWIAAKAWAGPVLA